MAFKRSGVRFSYAPQNTLKISKLQRLYTISYTVFTSCVYFLLLSPTILKPPRKHVPRWTKVYPFREFSAKLPRHTSARTQKNPAPRKEGRKFFSLLVRRPGRKTKARRQLQPRSTSPRPAWCRTSRRCWS